MKKYFYLTMLVILGLAIAACDDTTTEPEAVTTGSVYITSTPAGADIYIGTTDQGKNTPDSLTAMEAGNYQVTLKLTGYKDTTFTVTITAGKKATKAIVLTTTLSTTTFSPITIYESYNTGADKPSGLDLSTGTAASTSNTAVDLYYHTNQTWTTHELAGLSTRTTYFSVGTSSILTDGVSSPVKTSSWATTMSDLETNYVFIYDADHHYSKLKIVDWSSSVESPAWIKVQYIYNNTIDDVRF